MWHIIIIIILQHVFNDYDDFYVADNVYILHL